MNGPGEFVCTRSDDTATYIHVIKFKTKSVCMCCSKENYRHLDIDEGLETATRIAKQVFTNFLVKIGIILTMAMQNTKSTIILGEPNFPILAHI